MEASVVVCEPLKLPRLCHTENQPEVRKTATQKRARGARGAFVSLLGPTVSAPLTVCPTSQHPTTRGSWPVPTAHSPALKTLLSNK